MDDGELPIRPWWFPIVTEVHGHDHRTTGTGWSSFGWLEVQTAEMEKCASWEDLVKLVVDCMSAPVMKDCSMAKRLLSSSSSFFFGAIVPGTGSRCPRTSKFVPAAFTKLEGSVEFLNLGSKDMAFKTGTGVMLHRHDVHLVCVCEERSQFYARQERRRQRRLCCGLVATCAVAGAIAALVLYCVR